MAVTMALAISYSSAVVKGGFEELEAEQLLRNVDRCVAAIQNDLADLERTGRDWSAWDDTYDFARDPVGSAEFVEKNFRAAALANLNLALLIIVDTQGKVVWGRDIDEYGNTSDLSAFWPQESFTGDHPVLRAVGTTPVSGLVYVNKRLLAISAQTILRSDYSGVSAGTLIFGRAYNRGALDNLSQRLAMPIEILPVTRNRVEGLQRDHRTARQTAIVTDYFGQPTLAVTTSQPRAIMEKSRRANVALIVALLVSGLAYFVIVLLIVDRTVIRRILELRRYLHAIVGNPQREQLLPETVGADYRALTADINRCLLSLYGSRKELEQNYQNIQTLLDNTIEGIFTIDLDGNIVNFNQAAQRVFGYTLAEVRGSPIDQLLARADQRRHTLTTTRYSTKSVEDLRGAGREVLARRKDGSLFPAFIAISKEPVGSLQWYTGVVRDISTMKTEQERLIEDATTDPLTRLPNRKRFLSLLSEKVEAANVLNTPLVLCLCDLDQFKAVNDTYGHVPGDQVLERFSAVIRACIRSGDFAGRYGGDELCIALPDTDLKGAMVVIERIRTSVAIEEFEASDGRRFHVTCSFGLAQAARAGETVAALLQRADEALYEAKNGGGNAAVASPPPPAMGD